MILDNLATGRREFATGRAFYQGDIADGAVVDRIFAEHPEIYAVIHCAALIVVPQSMVDPIGYYRANVAKSLEFTDHLLRNGCERLMFSSSAAIYRAAEDLAVDEDSAIDPQSPYGRTKAVCEAMIARRSSAPCAVAPVFQPDWRRSQDADGPATAAADPCPRQDNPGA